MGKPRKIKSVTAMEEAWEEFKAYCDDQTVLTHEFSQKNSEFVSAELKRKITYTIEGFCVYIGLARATFYRTYCEDEKYADIVSRMKEECESDARQKFETGQIPPQLAGLWMSKYGYTTKSESREDVRNRVVIVDDLDG